MARTKNNIEHQPFSPKIWRGILPFFKPYRRRLAAIALLMLGCSAVDVLIPIYQKYMIDRFIVPRTAAGLLPFCALGAGVALAGTVMTVLFARQAMYVEMAFSRDLKKKLFDHLQTLSLQFYNETPVGYLIARLMSDTERIGGIVAWGLVDVSWGLSYIVFAVASMLVLDWRLGLIMLAVLPPMALVAVWFQGRILRANRKVRQLNSELTSAYNEGILGAKTTKTLAIEEVIAAEFEGTSGRMRQASVRAAVLSAVFMPIVMMLGSVAIALILTRGSALVASGALALGTLSAMISYAVGIVEPIRHIARIMTDAVATQVNIERVQGLLQRGADIQDSPEVIKAYGDSFNPRLENWEPIRGDIEFRDVTFRYGDGDNVLEHFNLTVPAGTVVAIVGETGAGKSTLVNLVCRFYEPNEGQILIDGRDYRERSQLWLHRNLGYVLQTPFLFSGSIRDNIRFGKEDATDEEIMAALRLAAAEHIVEKEPQGLDTDVGEGGDRLSTGEKQLLSFARAAIADPRLFVLDEATSSVDTETEQLIQKAIGNLLSGRTSFIIAHRLSTVKMADLILVVKDGKLIERGTHDELIARGGTYKKLYTMQFEEDPFKVTDTHAD